MNPELEREGILLTMYDKRNNLSQLVEQDIRQHFGDEVYSVVIPRNVKLSEAPSHGKPVILYDIASRGAVAYMDLAAYLIKKYKPVADEALSEQLIHANSQLIDQAQMGIDNI